MLVFVLSEEEDFQQFVAHLVLFEFEHPHQEIS
jgi:hypothetical protein